MEQSIWSKFSSLYIINTFLKKKNQAHQYQYFHNASSILWLQQKVGSTVLGVEGMAVDEMKAFFSKKLIFHHEDVDYSNIKYPASQPHSVLGLDPGTVGYPNPPVLKLLYKPYSLAHRLGTVTYKSLLYVVQGRQSLHCLGDNDQKYLCMYVLCLVTLHTNRAGVTCSNSEHCGEEL